MNKSRDCTIIQAQGISKIYNDGKIKLTVLNNVDFAIHAAEQIAILGRSGSGKSTLLHCLGGLDQVSSGKIQWLGQDLKKFSSAALSRMRNQLLGFVYQFHHLLTEFNLLENVAMPLLIRGESPSKSRNEAAALLKQLGLGERLEHKPAECSGGERQRCAIARAMVTRPKCIFADEPTGNLDKTTANEVWKLMLELNRKRGTSIVIVTHDEQLASQIPKRIYIDSQCLHEENLL